MDHPDFCYKCGADQNEVAQQFDIDQAKIVSENLLDPEQENKSEYSPFCDWCGKPFRGIIAGIVPAFPTNIFLPDHVVDLTKEGGRTASAFITRPMDLLIALGFYAGEFLIKHPSLANLLENLGRQAAYDQGVLVRVYRKSLMETPENLEHTKLHEEGHGAVWDFFHGGFAAQGSKQGQFKRAVESLMLSQYPEFEEYYQFGSYDSVKTRAGEFFADAYAWHYQPFIWLPYMDGPMLRYPDGVDYSNRNRMVIQKLLSNHIRREGISRSKMTNADLFAALRRPYTDLVVWIEEFLENWEDDFDKALVKRLDRIHDEDRGPGPAIIRRWKGRAARANPDVDLPQPPQVRAWSPEDDGTVMTPEVPQDNPPNFNKVVKMARRQGWIVEQTRGSHWKFIPPNRDMPAIVTSSTPSDHRQIFNFLSRMKRSGFVVENPQDNPVDPKMVPLIAEGDVDFLNELEEEAVEASRRADEYYEAGEFDLAEEWDAKAEEAYERLNDVVSEVMEGNEPLTGGSQESEGFTPDAYTYLSDIWAEYLRYKKTGNLTRDFFQDESEFAGAMRRFLKAEIPGFIETTTDQQILDAAKDAYEAKLPHWERGARAVLAEEEAKLKETMISLANRQGWTVEDIGDYIRFAGPDERRYPVVIRKPLYDHRGEMFSRLANAGLILNDKYLDARDNPSSCPVRHQMYGGLPTCGGYEMWTEYEVGASRIAEAVHCILGSIGKLGESWEHRLDWEEEHINEENDIIQRAMKEYRKPVYIDQLLRYERDYRKEHWASRREYAEKTIESIRRVSPCLKKLASEQLSRWMSQDLSGVPKEINDVVLWSYQVAIDLADALLDSVRWYPDHMHSAYNNPALINSVVMLNEAVEAYNRAAAADGAARDNPIDPEAYSREDRPCALIGPYGINRPDDRSGAHFTTVWGLAARYAIFKAGREGTIGVVLTYDLSGLDLVPDFDAEVEKEHGDWLVKECSWYIEEFDILADPEHPDYDRLADLMDGETDNESPEPTSPPWSVEKELIDQSKYPIFRVLAEKLRGGYEDADRALSAIMDGDVPLEWWAETVSQVRTYSMVHDDRLVSVELIKPVDVEIEGEDYPDEDVESCPTKLYMEDMDDVADAIYQTALKVWESTPGFQFHDEGKEVYYHGTDLIRAAAILKDSPAAEKLENPWHPCVQP